MNSRGVDIRDSVTGLSALSTTEKTVGLLGAGLGMGAAGGGAWASA